MTSTLSTGTPSGLLQAFQADVTPKYSALYDGTPTVTDAIVEVVPCKTNYFGLVAMTQLNYMKEWVSELQFQSISTQAVLIKTRPRVAAVEINVWDFEGDQVGVYARNVIRLGYIAKKDQDVQVVKALQCGWPATQASLFPGAQVQQSALTGDTLFSNTHTLNPNAPATPSSGFSAFNDGAAAGNQSNIVSGSYVNSQLIAAAHDRGIGFTGDKGIPLGPIATHVIFPPQQNTAVQMAVKSLTNPLASANSATSTPAGLNLTLTNVVAGYNLQPLLFQELNQDPNVVYLSFEIQGVKPFAFGVFKPKALVPNVDPTSPANFYGEMLQWKVVGNDSMQCPLWAQLIRISILGS